MALELLRNPSLWLLLAMCSLDMARKKQEDGPSLFGAETIKQKVYVGNPAAVAGGALAGVSTHFKTAIGEIEAVIKRCNDALATETCGKQGDKVLDIREQCVRALVPTIRSLWRDIDGIVLAGVALPEKKPTGELFG